MTKYTVNEKSRVLIILLKQKQARSAFQIVNAMQNKIVFSCLNFE